MSDTKHSQSLSERLMRYSAAASLVASGTVAAGALPVAATNELPKTVMVGETWDIDLNGDGTVEFTLRVGSASSSSFIDLTNFNTSVSLLGQPGGGGSFFPYAVWSGANINAGAGNWSSVTDYATLTIAGVAGEWNNINPTYTRYLGVRFDVSGTMYYGWLELKVVDADPGPPQVTIVAESAKPGSIPADVSLMSAQASGGLQAAAASGLAAIGGALTWLRRKVFRA